MGPSDLGLKNGEASLKPMIDQRLQIPGWDMVLVLHFEVTKEVQDSLSTTGTRLTAKFGQTLCRGAFTGRSNMTRRTQLQSSDPLAVEVFSCPLRCPYKHL